jgi:hypothetical protein
MGAASTSEIPQGQMVGFIEHWITTPDTIYYVLMFLLGSMLGMLLLAIGLYRARVTYRWAAALFLLGVLAVGAFHAMIALGIGGTGLAVLAMSDANWEKVRGAAPVAEAAPPVGAQPRVQ